jgi:hypothetical protein
MREDKHATVLLVSRVHVSQLGAEIWRVQTWDGQGRTEFETGEKDLVVLGANSEFADIKLLLNPETNRLIEWPTAASSKDGRIRTNRTRS